MSNIYKIGVNLAMTSNSAQVLGTLGRDLMGVNAKAKDLEGGLSRLKLALGGMIAIGAGIGILSMFRGPVEDAMKFEQAVTRFSQFGLPDKLNRDAVAFAKNMNIAGQSYTDAMKNITEAQGVFRESGLSGSEALRGAKMSAPILGKIDYANRILDPDQTGARHVQSMDMLRFIEMKGGLNSPERFNSLADAGYKAVVGSGGNVNWSLYRQFMATGGVAARGLSDKALFGEMEPVIGELKSRAGTALMTSFNRLTGITRVPNQVAHDLVSAGIWDGSKIEWNSMGGIKSMKGSPLKDQALFSQSQFEWYQKYIVPMYDAKHLSNDERARMDAMIGGRTGGMMFSLFRSQADPINRSVEAQAKALGIDASYGKAENTTAGKFADAQGKFTNLMIQVGSIILPMLNKGLTVLIPVLKGFSDWASAHPKLMGLAVKSILLFGGFLVAAGAIALAVATGPIGALVATFTAAGLAVMALNAYFEKFMGWIGKMLAAFGGFLVKYNIVTLGGGGPIAPSPASAKTVQVHTQLNMDGRKVAEAVSTHQAKAMNRPGAVSGIDLTLGGFGPAINPAH